MATSAPVHTEKMVGKAIRRREDPRLLTGNATYVDDMQMPGMYHACIVRSPHAAAKIKGIDITAAKAAEGVVAVFTGADTASIGPVPTGVSLPGMKVPAHKVLATDRVYYVGHAVAIVVATDKYLARDGADLVEVDYDPTQAVADPEKAVAPGAPLVHPEYENNVAFTYHQENGEVDKVFAEADVVVKQRIVSQRLIPTAMETRGVVADWKHGDAALTIYTSTQIPHLARTLLAGMLGMPEHKLRIVAPEVGGGFGSKLNVYGEEALLGFVSKQLRKPVKWIESRRENCAVTIHGRGHVDHLELAAKKDGTITGLKIHILSDLGAYHQLLTALIPQLSLLMVPGLYNFHTVRADITGVFTNCVPTDAYRGAGRPEATHVIERMVDMVSAELGLDPAELRVKNFPRPEDFPFQTATGLVYDSGNYEWPLRQALATVAYEDLKKEQTAARAAGRLFGIGISTYGEICAMGPSPAMPAGGWESATVKVEPSGVVTVLTGSSPHGQGEETTFAQITADALGVGVDDVAVLHGDTSVVQYGIGTFGSRATAVGGAALWYALQEVRAKMKRFAEMLLDSDDVDLVGSNWVCNKTGRTVSVVEIAGAAYGAKRLPQGVDPGLVATRFWEPTNFAYPFGAHIAVTEVDRETGTIKILRYVAVDDCGNIINPLLVAGQVHGGIVQALGQAIYEHAVYDDDGQLLSGELMDYAIPRARMVPWMECSHTTTPSPVNPLGVKGVGEAGTIGCSPALVNSVTDALRPLGIRHVDMPMTPQRIWKMIQEAQA
ncbi:MAG: xanthine dehydrogenase family protein molybdopterin-binding subunit [Bryobacteraceae bacterium]|nr:xanthine dehydrogenase family protein molybdopterin-binding subunit [Bryobacteraceae bacterium]